MQTLPTWSVLDYWGLSSYALVSSMLMISISKLSNSVYLSWAFQLNEDCSEAGLACLWLLRLTVSAGWSPASVSLSAIITTVTAG